MRRNFDIILLMQIEHFIYEILIVYLLFACENSQYNDWLHDEKNYNFVKMKCDQSILSVCVHTLR